MMSESDSRTVKPDLAKCVSSIHTCDALRFKCTLRKCEPLSYLLMTMEMCPTLNLLPAALVATRVVSFPAEDVFTCDVGSKSCLSMAWVGHTPGFVVGRCSTSGDAGHVTYSSCNVSPVHTGVIIGNLLQFLPPAAK